MRTITFNPDDYKALAGAFTKLYDPQDKCLGAGCYSLSDDWATQVRKAHGERIAARQAANRPW